MPKLDTLIYITIFIILVIPCNKLLAQQTTDRLNLDSIKSISLNEFNYRIDRAIKLLRKKPLSTISDTDHINIMMCLNTIFMKHIPGSIEQRFKGGRYTEIEKLEKEKNYSRDIVKVYSDWIPDRGMGYYFKKLRMELYGTPHLYAMFEVSEE
jgi:hypothetical protein